MPTIVIYIIMTSDGEWLILHKNLNHSDMNRHAIKLTKPKIIIYELFTYLQKHLQTQTFASYLFQLHADTNTVAILTRRRL